MLQEKEFEKAIWRSRWPIIVAVVAMALIVVQIIRVNRPREESGEEIVSPIKYTSRGPLLNGNVSVAANGFHSTRIELNRRAKLAGSFRTPNIRLRVSVLVMDETTFENWKSDQTYKAIVETGNVPVGKINAAIDPGVYYLVINNRRSDTEQSVYTDFSID